MRFVLVCREKDADPGRAGFSFGLAILALGIIFALAAAGCRTAPSLDPMTGDPFYEAFFEKTSLIMTDDEIEIYRSLPDRESKAAFIEDFWQSRDIDPTTEANEGRAEFERRVAFANTWFSDWRTFRGKTKAVGEEADRGWDTDPGRIFILLGPPDYLSDENGMLEPFDPTRLYRQSDPVPMDASPSRESMTWVYERIGVDRPRLYVYFYRSGTIGRWRSNIFSSREGRDAIERAKLNYLAEDLRDAVKVPFRCSVKYARDAVLFKFRTSCLNYAEEGGKLKASLKVKVVVYRGGHREDVVEKTEDFAFAEDELLATKNLEFSIPWRPREKGRYLFDILVTDMKSLRFAAFRTYLRKKL
ncbi:MAG: GWxTD domain-containing protein [Candidatus Aminicenantes bacterium]|nr:GWxTD domain-containing protein [Candidatus Aminicenantes bacterium]